MVGGAIGIAGAVAVEYSKWRMSARPHAAIVLRYLLDIIIDCGIAYGVVKLRMDAGQTVNDPHDPQISGIRDRFREDMEAVRQLAERSGLWLPDALRDLLMIDTDLGLLVHALSEQTPLLDLLKKLDAAGERFRRLDKLVSRRA